MTKEAGLDASPKGEGDNYSLEEGSGIASS